MIRRRIFNKEIKKRVIKIRIGLIKWLYIKKGYTRKKEGSLRDKKGYVFKKGNGIPYYLTFQNKNRGQI